MPLPAFSDLNKQQQLALLIGAPLIVAFLLLWMNNNTLKKLGPDPLLPKFIQKPAGTWTVIAGKVAEIAVQQAIIDEKPAREAELKTLQSEIKLAEERLPTEAEKSDMSDLITRLGSEIPSEIGAVQFKSVKISEDKKDATNKKSDSYQTVTYQTELEGDMNGIIKYIDMIEKNARFMTIKSLHVKPGSVTVDDQAQKIVYGLHAVSMEIVTYVYNPTGKAKPQ